jgi:hypothetical protein
VVFVSGYSDTAAVHDAVGPGAHLIGKPFAIAALAQEIEKVLGVRPRAQAAGLA